MPFALADILAHCACKESWLCMCASSGCVCVRETWGACCWVLWRHVKGRAPPPSYTRLAVDWWGRCCPCSLIHHTLYLGFRGKEKGKKTSKYIRAGGLGCGGLRSWVRGGPLSCLVLLSCPPPPLFRQMLEKKSYPCDPLPFSSSSTDNKRQIKPNGGGQI